MNGMTVFFVPYSGDAPAAIEINGHKVLIVASDSEDIQTDLSLIGADDVREVYLGRDDEDISEVLADLAANVGGGVVMTPPGVSPSDMIDNLSRELPWIH
jgi:hypothetical protein